MRVSAPKVSIIVPVHNVERFLPACLGSLLRGQGDDVEVLAVDDGSTDGSLQVLRGYAQQYSSLRIIPLQENRGVSAARNSGLDQSRGEYVLFVDADDRLAEGAVPRLLLAIAGEAPDIIMFQHRSVTECGNVLQGPVCAVDRLFDITDPRQQRSAFQTAAGNLLAWNALYRRQSLGELRFLPFPNGEDVLFGVQAFCRAKTLRVCPDVLYEYVQREGSASKLKTKRHCLSAIEVSCLMAQSVMLWSGYRQVKDLLFRKVRGLAHGLTLNVLLAVPAGDRDSCWLFWFDQFARVFCGTDLVPISQRWLYRLVYRSRNRTLVWLAFRLPIRVKTFALAFPTFRRAWVRCRA